MTRRVRAMHKRVCGQLTEQAGIYAPGMPYRADDPQLLLWVLFSLVDSALVVYQRYVRLLSRAEKTAFCEDYKVVARLFGLKPSYMPDAGGPLDAYRAHAGGR